MLSQQQIIALAVEAGFDDITPWLDAENVEQGQIDAANRWIERMTAFAALVSAKETQARQAAQLELEQYRNEAQQRAGVLIKEAYQRGVRDEREACAKVCDEKSDTSNTPSGRSRAESCALAIRARSAETKEQ